MSRHVLHGFCAPTVDGDNGDCDAGDFGSWLAKPSGVTTIGDCAALCSGCPRCNYVSFSAAANDCSWYYNCNLDALRTDFGSTHESLAVVREPEASRAAGVMDRAASGKRGGPFQCLAALCDPVHQHQPRVAESQRLRAYDPHGRWLDLS